MNIDFTRDIFAESPNDKSPILETRTQVVRDRFAILPAYARVRTVYRYGRNLANTRFRYLRETEREKERGIRRRR